MLNRFKTKIGQGKVCRTLSEITLKPTSVFALDIESSGVPGKGLPGDSPNFSGHGVAGVSLCNIFGDSAYYPVNDGRDNGGVSIQEAIRYLNTHWMPQASVIAIHNCAFDWSFLSARGLDVSRVESGKAKIIDTMILSTLRCQGSFTSSKLKELMEKQYGFDTSADKLKTAWLDAHNTNDFADLPFELISKYACDDTVLVMAYLLCASPLSSAEMAVHDLLVRNVRHLIKASALGVAVAVQTLKSHLDEADVQRSKYATELEGLLPGAVKVEEEQKVLQLLHSKGLHSPPRQVYGEMKYQIDKSFLETVCENPLATAYLEWRNYDDFIQAFSAVKGECATRIWSTSERDAGFHPHLFMSIFSKNGLVNCRCPDITNKVKLTDEIRHLFLPRRGHMFILVQAHDIPTLVLGAYLDDPRLVFSAQTGGVLADLQSRAKLPEGAVPCLLRKTLEGSGMALLDRRLEAHGVTTKQKQSFSLLDVFNNNILHGKLQAVENGMKEAMDKRGFVLDALGRRFALPQDSRYRTFATILGSSVGAIYSTALDALCRLAAKTEAQLVLVHEKEFVFEVPVGSTKFMEEAQVLLQQPLVPGMPWGRFIVGKQPWLGIGNTEEL